MSNIPLQPPVIAGLRLVAEAAEEVSINTTDIPAGVAIGYALFARELHRRLDEAKAPRVNRDPDTPPGE